MEFTTAQIVLFCVTAVGILVDKTWTIYRSRKKDKQVKGLLNEILAIKSKISIPTDLDAKINELFKLLSESKSQEVHKELMDLLYQKQNLLIKSIEGDDNFNDKLEAIAKQFVVMLDQIRRVMDPTINATQITKNKS